MELIPLIESLLFIHGEPLSYRELKKVTGASQEEVKEAIKGLREAKKGSTSGTEILIHKDRVQLVTKAVHAPYIQKIQSNVLQEELSSAASETIAIVGYLGPFSKINIAHIRGVNSGYILRNLLIRGLLERHTSTSSDTSLYAVSADFLKAMGLSHIEALPEYEKYHSLIDTFKDNYEIYKSA